MIIVNSHCRSRPQGRFAALITGFGWTTLPTFFIENSSIKPLQATSRQSHNLDDQNLLNHIRRTKPTHLKTLVSCLSKRFAFNPNNHRNHRNNRIIIRFSIIIWCVQNCTPDSNELPSSCPIPGGRLNYPLEIHCFSGRLFTGQC